MSHCPISKIPVVTIDGPSSSGKGTIGKMLADHLGWHFLDSGILYRVLAFATLQQNIPPAAVGPIAALARDLPVKIVDGINHSQHIFYQNNDITDAIREEKCGARASEIAILPEIRNALLTSYHQLRVAPGLVADGRDMGTVVFPDAILKIFLTATTAVRAQRRWQQLQKRGIDVSLRAVTADLEERDRRDSERTVAPLQAAADATLLDTSALSIDEVLKVLLERARKALA